MDYGQVADLPHQQQHEPVEVSLAVGWLSKTDWGAPAMGGTTFAGGASPQEELGGASPQEELEHADRTNAGGASPQEELGGASPQEERGHADRTMEGGRDVDRMWIWKGHSKTDWDAPVMGGTTSACEELGGASPQEELGHADRTICRGRRKKGQPRRGLARAP